MNSTFHNFTGLAPQSNSYIAMMNAKFEKQEKETQMHKMEARIIKLRKDNEKTSKRVNDAKRQQDFVITMKNEKQK